MRPVAVLDELVCNSPPMVFSWYPGYFHPILIHCTLQSESRQSGAHANTVATVVRAFRPISSPHEKAASSRCGDTTKRRPRKTGVSKLDSQWTAPTYSRLKPRHVSVNIRRPLAARSKRHETYQPTLLTWLFCSGRGGRRTGVCSGFGRAAFHPGFMFFVFLLGLGRGGCRVCRSSNRTRNLWS